MLLQLPPSLVFEAGTSDDFLRELRSRASSSIVCEPRHRSRFTPEVNSLLDELRIARVAADPAPVRGAGKPGGWRGLSYWRLHGSPRIYYSPYSNEAVAHMADQLVADQAVDREAWCIFDNTAAFAATRDALSTKELVEAS